MDYSANVDAVVGFAREVFPAIRAARGDARFYIVGARPTAAVRALAQQQGIVVTGTVPDVRPWLAHAHFALAPLRIARGVQNKVLEALAMGRAVLATREAAEGIELDVPALTVVADAADYARRALDWLTHGEPSSAREVVLARYSWPGRLVHLDALLDTLARSQPGVGVPGDLRGTARAVTGS
jgi:glycosyltransferase involved in cell wall biosynthesis